jgi:hypothetical protein
MAKTKRTPHRPLVSTNPRGIAARVAATCPSPHRFQPLRANCPPAYLTQDQRGEHSRSLISAVAAAKATKPADDSGDDNNDDDKDDVRSIGNKGNDSGDDKQGVKEGSMLLPPKPPNQVVMIPKMMMTTRRRTRMTRRCKRVSNKWGDKYDDPSASMGSGSSSSLSDKVVT